MTPPKPRAWGGVPRCCSTTPTRGIFPARQARPGVRGGLEERGDSSSCSRVGFFASLSLILRCSVIFLFCFVFKFYLFIYFGLCWVFVSMRGLPLVAASGGHSSSRCAGLSLSRPLLLRSTGSRHAGSVVVAHGPSRSAACGIFPDQGSNPCPLHWQADSQPLCHQGSLSFCFDGKT